MTRITQFARPKHRNFNTHVWHFLPFFVCQPKHGADERRSERRVTRWKSSFTHGIGIAEQKRIIRFAFLIATLLFRFRKLRDAPSITFGDHCKSSEWWENEAKKDLNARRCFKQKQPKKSTVIVVVRMGKGNKIESFWSKLFSSLRSHKLWLIEWKWMIRN